MERQKSKLWVLVKLRLHEFFGSMLLGRRTNRINKRGVSRGGAIAIYILLVVSFTFMFGSFFLSMAMTFIPQGLNWLYFALMAVFIFIFLVLGSVFTAYSQLFQAKDNDQIMSLPVQPGTVLLSRLVSLLILNYIYELLVVVPGISIYLGFNGGATVGGSIIFLILALLFPFLPLFVSLVFGWLIGKLVSKTRHKNVLTLILSLAGMGLYFFFVFGINGRIGNMFERTSDIAAWIETKLPPAYWFGKAIAEPDIIYALITVLLCVIPFALAAALLSKSYGKLAISKSSEARIEYKGGGLKERGSFYGMVDLELKRFLSSPAYVVNGGMGLIFYGIIAFVALFKRNDFLEIVKEMNIPTGYLGMGLVIVVLFANALVMISSATVSLEAKTLWIYKSTPVKEEEILYAKAMPHIISCIPFILVVGVILQFVVPMSIAARIGIFLLPLAAALFNALFGVYINLCFPKFDWLNEAAAVKQGLAPFLAMLVNGLVALLTLVLFTLWIFGNLNPDLFLIPALVLYILLSLLVYITLKTRGVVKWLEL